jgi:hypothetical protein
MAIEHPKGGMASESFLRAIESAWPPDRDVCVSIDNHSTHNHPKFNQKIARFRRIGDLAGGELKHHRRSSFIDHDLNCDGSIAGLASDAVTVRTLPSTPLSSTSDSSGSGSLARFPSHFGSARQLQATLDDIRGSRLKRAEGSGHACCVVGRRRSI